MNEKHFRPHEASQYLLQNFGIQRAVGTLAKGRCLGGNVPAFRRVGRAIYYAESDLRQWAEMALSTTYRTTSDSTA